MKKLVALIISCLFVSASTSTSATTSRSTTERRHFVDAHHCPLNDKKVYTHCTGYRIDHIKPLCAGGSDTASNMQWSKLAESLSKDKIEIAYCACVRHHGTNSCPVIEWKATSPLWSYSK